MILQSAGECKTKGKPRGGSRKGRPNRITADLKAMILEALSDAGGVEYLKARAVDTPASFLTLIGKVLPTTISGDPENPMRYVHTITLSAGEFKPEHPATAETR